MLATAPRPIYSSGECEIDLGRKELRIGGTTAPMGGRAFQIIEILVESAGGLVTKDELRSRIWPDVVVQENTLAVHAMAVRRALGPYRDLLKTDAGRGYRLVGSWTPRSPDHNGAAIGRRLLQPTAEAAAHNLPMPTGELVGRKGILQKLCDLVSAYRLVTLTGPGGIGKTRTAIEVARLLLPEFQGEVYFVELASLSDSSLIASAIASAGLGTSNNDSSLEGLARAIGDRRLLLIIDNCEHLIEAAARAVETLMQQCPAVSIVATSRELMRIEWEYAYRIPPLDLPILGRPGRDEDKIRESSAVQLFLSRMAAQHAGDPYQDGADLPTIAAICSHLDGIPLAIEFGAARAATLGVRWVLSHLGDRFSLLTSGRRTAPPKHKTLRAALDWSYHLLSDQERRVLRQVSIFVSSFTVEGANAVAEGGADDTEIVSLLADLVEKSLINHEILNAEFRLLETTRAYAVQKLGERGELTTVARRHATYFLSLLTCGEPTSTIDIAAARLAALRRRSDEAHSALEWAFSASGDVEIAIGLTIAAVPLWFSLSQLSVVRARSERALSLIDPGTYQEMTLRMAIGHAIWYLDPNSEEIKPTFLRALVVARDLGETSVQTQALWGIWAAHRGRGEYHAALDVANQYEAAAGKTADAGALHLADRILGLTHHFLGDQIAAQRFIERALSQLVKMNQTSRFGYQVETPIAMAVLSARILWLQGFPEKARAAARGAIEAARNDGNMFSIYYALTWACVPVALWTGDFSEGERLIEALVEYSEVNPRVEMEARCFAAIIRLRRGDECDALVASYVEPRMDIFSFRSLASFVSQRNIALPSGDVDYSEEELWNTTELLRVDAELTLHHNLPGAGERAEELLLRSLRIARRQFALSWELRTATTLSSLWRARGRAAEARDLLARVYGRFTEGFETKDLAQAKNLLATLK